MHRELIQTVIECAIDGSELLIHHEGVMYHRLCGEPVSTNLEGNTSLCIKQVGHLSNVHEDWLGQQTMDQMTIEGL